MAGAMGRQRCKHETNAARLVGGCCRGRLVGSLGMGADPNTSLPDGHWSDQQAPDRVQAALAALGATLDQKA